MSNQSQPPSSPVTSRGATDWTAYYESVPSTARVTRRYTARTLVRFLRGCAASATTHPRVAEIGGANSCFAADVKRAWPDVQYHVIDTNAAGLAMFADRFSSAPGFTSEQLDVLSLPSVARLGGCFDIVYSVGLIEHFDRERTREAIVAHFALAREGGAVILSYPTPTLLYRFARWVIESVGAWQFPDERPLRRDEVMAAIPPGWRVTREMTLWPLILTQHMAVFERRSEEAGTPVRRHP